MGGGKNFKMFFWSIFSQNQAILSTFRFFHFFPKKNENCGHYVCLASSGKSGHYICLPSSFIPAAKGSARTPLWPIPKFALPTFVYPFWEKSIQTTLFCLHGIHSECPLSKCPLTHCLPYRLSPSGRPSELWIKQLGTIWLQCATKWKRQINFSQACVWATNLNWKCEDWYPVNL